MTEVGRKYNVTIEALAVSREIQDEMPIWYHRFSSGNRTLFNTNVHVVQCLKEKHRVTWVKDARILSRKARTARHINQEDCDCNVCMITRAITKCEHPNRCYAKAQELLNSLENKWDPRVPQPED
ncbi:hypothetical protein C8F04DRAFT_876726, partial [Mycena alexandri]